MRCGLQTHFEAPIGVDTCHMVAALGFTIARAAVSTVDQNTFDAIRQEIEAAGLTPLWIIRREQIPWCRPWEMAELGMAGREGRHEPDLFPPEVQRQYLGELPIAFHLAADCGVRMGAGGISNLNKRGFAFLDEMMPRVPDGVPVIVHRYPEKDGPQAAHAPARERLEELTALRRRIGYRHPLWCTEVGYHTAEGWSDEQVASFARWEQNWWRFSGAEVLCWFQLNDGERNIMEERFGIRCHDGRWKPVADVWKVNVS